MTTLAKRIRIARIQLDWSREELAHKAGVCCDTIRNLETGAHRPYLRTISQIFRVIRQHGVDMPEPREAYRELSGFQQSVAQHKALDCRPQDQVWGAYQTPTGQPSAD